MKLKNLSKIFILAMISMSVGFAGGQIYHQSTLEPKLEEEEAIEKAPDPSSPSCVRMDYYITKHAETYGIPKKYALGIARYETSYTGPTDWDYNHKRTSKAGALGPMQIMYSTAKEVWPGKKFTKEKLKNDIDFNVETSMKILKKLHNRYGDWKIVFGYYNTGRPRVNSYALSVYNHEGEN